MEPVDKVRILVLGDAGVGKSTFIQQACHPHWFRNSSSGTGFQSAAQSQLTGGFYCDVSIHEPQPQQGNVSRPFFVEWLEVPGRTKQPETRSVFYTGHSSPSAPSSVGSPAVHGLVLVHDYLNNKSHQNLWRWMEEFAHATGLKFRPAPHFIGGSRPGMSSSQDTQSVDNWGAYSGATVSSSSPSTYQRKMGSSGAIGNNATLQGRSSSHEFSMRIPSVGQLASNNPVPASTVNPSSQYQHCVPILMVGMNPNAMQDTSRDSMADDVGAFRIAWDLHRFPGPHSTPSAGYKDSENPWTSLHAFLDQVILHHRHY